MKQPALLQKGFTLIELIVVMAVIAILAGIVLVGLNPLEQTRKATDASRTETVSKLGEAVLRYQIQNSTLPTADTSWQSTLEGTGDIKSVANGGGAATGDCTALEGGYCYLIGTAPNDDEFIVFTLASSNGSTTQGGCGSNQAFLVYSSMAQKTGVGCTTPAVDMALDAGLTN